MKTLVLSLLAATSLLASSGASACDKTKAHDETATTAKACAHGETATNAKACCVSGAACCSTGAACCSQVTVADESASDAKASCPHTLKAVSVAEVKGGCPFAGAKHAVTAQAVKTTDVKLTGRLLCEHCNLHKAADCKPVFQAEGEAEYVSADGQEMEAVRTASDHGKNLLAIEGKLHEDAEGSKVLEITAWNKVEEPRT